MKKTLKLSVLQIETWFRLIKQDDSSLSLLFVLKVNQKNKNIEHSQRTLRRCSVSEGHTENRVFTRYGFIVKWTEPLLL